MKYRLPLFFLFLLSGCHSAPPARESSAATPAPAPAPDAPYYVETHLDFAGWNRTPDCCTAKGPKMAVASAGTNSSKAALEMAKVGGTVVDAAVAGAFALCVERPYSTGIAGGGFLLMHREGAKAGFDTFLDFRETAPRKATRTMFLDANGEIVKGKSMNGPFAVATPGLVAGLHEAHRKGGKLSWKKVLEPSIRLAEEGFPVYKSLAERIVKHQDTIKQDPYLASLLFHADGTPLKQGEVLRQPELAKTLKLIAAKGPTEFYRGSLARKIAAFMKEKGGLIDEKDLAAYRVRTRQPIRAKFHDYEIVGAPPPSGGGVVMAEMFQILEAFDLGREARDPAEYAHLMSQVMKRGFADRTLLIGDPDMTKAPFRKVLEPAYTDKARKALDRAKNTPSSEIAPAAPVPNKTGTAQLSVMDRFGNAVAVTITINGPWGAGIAVPGTGMILNNEMDDFTAKPAGKSESMSGIVGGEINAVAPGKRPSSSMSPTIVLHGGKPVVVLGGSGGSRILSGVFQTVVNYVIVFPKDIRRSLFAQRVHHQWMPDRLELEGAFTDAQKEALKAKGHELGTFGWSGVLQAVARDEQGDLTAVHDPRDEGGAAAE